MANKDVALASWRSLQTVIKDMTEDDLRECLKHEIINKGRKDMIDRMHKRYNALRKEREQFEFSIGITSSLEG